MKVLFLSAANSSHTIKWVNALAEKGHEVHLVYKKNHSPVYNQIDESVQLHSLKHGGMKGYYLNALQLNRIAKRIRPEVINVHYASGYGTLARWSKIGPYLLSVWGSDVYEFPHKNKTNLYILKQNIRHAKMLASTSECMAEQLKDVIGDSSLDIAVTPFGVDLTRFKFEEHSEKSDDEIILGTVKTLEKVYRIEDLIRATKVLKENLFQKGRQDIGNKIKVYIYGEGNFKEELKMLIRELELEGTVFLKGWIPNTEVPNALGQFDVFCATSERESFGVAVVEAMAMEKPVIVSDAEGFKEVVVDGTTGFVVSVGDIQAMAKRLEGLILDEKKRTEMGVNGRKRVEELYDWNKNVEIMENLYIKLRGQKDG